MINCNWLESPYSKNSDQKALSTCTKAKFTQPKSLKCEQKLCEKLFDAIVECIIFENNFSY